MVRPESLVAVQGARFETLGDLVWYSVSRMLVSREDLARAAETAGLEPGLLPGEITPHDAFRRATSERDEQEIALHGGQTVRLLIREVAASPERIVRQVVREVINAQQVRLEYTPIASLTLDRETGRVSVDWLASTRFDEGLRVDEILRHYELCRTHYNDIHIRDIVRRVLAGCQPTPLRRAGGVYFVPRDHRGEVHALQAFLAALAEQRSGGAALWAVPVIDTQEQREMVRTHLAEYVAVELERLKSEMADLLRTGRSISESQARRYAEAVRALRQQVTDYQQLLREALDETDAAVEVVLQQAVSLLHRVAT